jgi:AcrR family transcriptional regulator
VARVKPKRVYDSALRKQQAGQTRMRILDAAQELFAARGYPASTVEAIAAAAGVAVDTVYATFGSKREVLKSLLDVRVGGDDATIDLLDRPGPQAVRAERNQQTQLSTFARDVTEIIERVRPVDDIIRGAAAVDADVAALRVRIQESRYQSMREFVSWVAANGPLRDGLNEEDAATILWTLTSPEVHGLLRAVRGWPAERYTAWLNDSLTRILLP